MSGCIIDSAFRPHPWMRGAHVQTIAPALLRPLPALDWQRERIETPDGDFVDLGWHGDPQALRVAVLIHGLTGGFESKYLRGTARLLASRGWRCVALQLRGGGEEPNRTPKLYNHGHTEDLRHLWQLLRQRHPQARVATVGWSLGANVLLRALAEEREAAPLQAAIAACAPFELELCAQRLRTGFARVYQKKLLDGLKDMVRRRHGPLPVPARVDIAATLRARDFFEFDDAYMAPLAGYRDARDYYACCSTTQFLGAIRVPTRIVNAVDDPFMTPAILPRAGALSPAVTLELAACGGHVGFMTRDVRGAVRFWLEHHIADQLDVAVPAR